MIKSSIKFFFVLLLTLAAVAIIFPALPIYAETRTINLFTNVQPSLAMIIDQHEINFGMITAGIPADGGHGVDIAVSTNSANGYYLAISDGTPNDESSMLNADGSTRIKDFSGAIDFPQMFQRGVSSGLAFSLYSAMSGKELKWGDGTEYNDTRNKYAGVPEQATIFHQAKGYKNFVDHSFISFLLDIPSNQKTGKYSGNIVLSSTCMLN